MEGSYTPAIDYANAFQDGMETVYKSEGWKEGYEMNKVDWIDTTRKMVTEKAEENYFSLLGIPFGIITIDYMVY